MMWQVLVIDSFRHERLLRFRSQKENSEKYIPNYTSRHYQGAADLVRIFGILLVNSCGHRICILKTTFSSDSISAARVDDDSSDAFPRALLQGLSTDCYWGSLELVLGKYSGGGSRHLRRNNRKVRERFITWLYANMNS